MGKKKMFLLVVCVFLGMFVASFLGQLKGVFFSGYFRLTERGEREMRVAREGRSGKKN